MSRRWSALLFVLGVTVIVRLPHYDITMFAADQIFMMTQARQVLAGHWDIVRPDAAGLNILGPLYTFLLAGLLWIRDDPAFLGLFGVGCEILATWFVYDTARRVSGTAAAIAAAATYSLAPVLVLTTRLISYPSPLTPLVTGGWWLLVRHCQSPSTAKLISVALIAGLMPTLHATGLFFSAALILAVVIVKPPSWGQLVAACVAGALPLAPLLPRLFSSTNDVGALGARLGLMDPLPTLDGLVQLILRFPMAVIGAHWTAVLSVSAIHVQTIVATVGLTRGLAQRDPYWPLWLGIAASTFLNLATAFIYDWYLSWYYFMLITPGLCLCVAHAVGALSRYRVHASAVMVLVAATHFAFLDQFDGPAAASGLISLNAPRLMLRVPASTEQIHFTTLHELQLVGLALRDVVPDGATAMLVAHGARGELWRETGAEFLPPAPTPRDRWRAQFLLVGPGATVLSPGARLINERVCVFDRPTNLSWRMQHRPSMAGWELPQFVDADWPSLELPRRVPRPSRAGINNALATWREPHLALRGRFTTGAQSRRHALGVVMHGLGNSQHWIARAFVNGTVTTPARDRVMYSPFSRNQEWFFDVTELIRPGENLVALEIDGHMPVFDLDIFEIPCLDAEWYY